MSYDLHWCFYIIYMAIVQWLSDPYVQKCHAKTYLNRSKCLYIRRNRYNGTRPVVSRRLTSFCRVNLCMHQIRLNKTHEVWICIRIYQSLGTLDHLDNNLFRHAACMHTRTMQTRTHAHTHGIRWHARKPHARMHTHNCSNNYFTDSLFWGKKLYLLKCASVVTVTVVVFCSMIPSVVTCPGREVIATLEAEI